MILVANLTLNEPKKDWFLNGKMVLIIWWFISRGLIKNILDNIIIIGKSNSSWKK